MADIHEALHQHYTQSAPPNHNDLELLAQALPAIHALAMVTRKKLDLAQEEQGTSEAATKLCRELRTRRVYYEQETRKQRKHELSREDAEREIQSDKSWDERDAREWEAPRREAVRLRAVCASLEAKLAVQERRYIQLLVLYQSEFRLLDFKMSTLWEDLQNVFVERPNWWAKNFIDPNPDIEFVGRRVRRHRG